MSEPTTAGHWGCTHDWAVSGELDICSLTRVKMTDCCMKYYNDSWHITTRTEWKLFPLEGCDIWNERNEKGNGNFILIGLYYYEIILTLNTRKQSVVVRYLITKFCHYTDPTHIDQCTFTWSHSASLSLPVMYSYSEDIKSYSLIVGGRAGGHCLLIILPPPCSNNTPACLSAWSFCVFIIS